MYKVCAFLFGANNICGVELCLTDIYLYIIIYNNTCVTYINI